MKSDRTSIELNNLYLSPYVESALVAEPIATYQAQKTPQWLQVLVDCPGIQGLYTYSLPPELTVESGDIVSVPFGTQITGGNSY